MGFRPITEDEIAIDAPTPSATFRPITEDEIAEETPSLLSDPIGALTSKDWWLTDNYGRKRSAAQSIAGPAMAALQGLTFGSGDEIVAGGSAIAKDVASVFTGGPEGNYDEELAKVKSVEAETPTAARLAMGLAGALKAPLPNVTSKSKGVINAGKNIAKQVALGTGVGTVTGALSADEGERTEGAKEGALYGGLFSGGGQAVSEVAQGVGNYLASNAPKMARYSLGARQADYNKTAKELGIFDLADDEDVATATKKALDSFLGNEKASSTRDFGQLTKNALKIQENADDAVLSMVRSYDSNVGKAVYPNFNRLRQWVRSGAVPADDIGDYLKKIDKLEQSIIDEGGGTLEFLQKQKVAYGKKYDPNASSIDQQYTRQLYRTLRETIEDAVPGVAPHNKVSGEMQIITPILKKGLSAEESANVLERFKRSGIATTGGVGALTLGAGVPVAAGAAALGYMATTPQGQKIASQIMSQGGKLAAMGEKGQAIARALSVTGPLALNGVEDSGKFSLRPGQTAGSNQSEATTTGGIESTTQPQLPSELAAEIENSLAQKAGAQALAERKQENVRATSDQLGLSEYKNEMPGSASSRASGTGTDTRLRNLRSKGPSSDLPANPITKQDILFGDVLGRAKKSGQKEDVITDMFDGKKNQKVQKIEALIDSDPVDAAIYETESGRNPFAKNPESTARGAFQLLKNTAKALGVKDALDIEDNYKGYQKLKAEHVARFGNDPETIYSAHYLGAPVLAKVLAGKELTEKEQSQVDYLRAKALPRFRRIYQRILSKRIGVEEV